MAKKKRRISREARVVKRLSQTTEAVTPIGTGIIIPNMSGSVRTPAHNTDVANKKYVDDNAGAPEGTAVKSTGEAGGTKFLREDGDGTSSWQEVTHTPEGTAILSTGEAGGSKFLREDGDGTCSWQTPGGGGDALTTDPLSQFAATTSLQLKGVISDETGSGALTFATSPTLVTPVLGTPTSGTLTNCTGLPVAGTLLSAGTNCTLSTNTLNIDDAFIVNDADDTSTGKITAANFAVTADNNTNDTTYVPMVLHGTDATPPTASTVPRGTIYVQYTA